MASIRDLPLLKTAQMTMPRENMSLRRLHCDVVCTSGAEDTEKRIGEVK